MTTNLSRYAATSIRCLSRWGKCVFNFVTFNLIALEEQTIISQHKVVLVFDPTFIPKSEEKSMGFNTSHSKSEKGFEASSLLGLAEYLWKYCKYHEKLIKFNRH